MDSRIKEAKRLNKDLFIILIDLKDAFDSIAHSAIIAAFEAEGIGHGCLSLLEVMYIGNVTQLLTSEDLSEEIPVINGVKLGCPLSVIAFNITIDPLFEIIQLLRTILNALHHTNNNALDATELRM